MNTQKIISFTERLAAIFIVLIIIQKVGGYFIYPYMKIILNQNEFVELNSVQKFWGTVSNLIGIICNIGISIWVFITAKRENLKPFLWSLLCLLNGLLAAIFFYIVLYIDSVNKNK